MKFKLNSFKQFKTKDLILNLLLFLVGFSVPFAQAFNSICIGLLFLYSFLWFNKIFYKKLFNGKFRTHLLFIIYFIIMLCGVFYSDDVNGGLNYLIKNIVFLILPIAFINLSETLNYRKIKLSIYGLVAGISLILLSIHTSIFIEIFSKNLELKSLFTDFVRVEFIEKGLVEIHPPYFGILVVFSIIAVLTFNFFKNGLLNKITQSLIVAYFLLSIYGISSFMAVVLLGIFFLIYILILIKKKKIKYLLLILLPFVFALILGLSLKENTLNKFSGDTLIGRVVWSFYKGKGDTSRPENWKSVYMVVKDNLFIGVGSYGGLNHLQDNRDKKSESYKNEHNAHNQYLETLLRHGIFGLLIYLSIIYILSYNALKSKEILFWSFIIIFGIASITESYLVRQIGLAFFTFFALLFSTFYNFDHKKNRFEKSFNT